MPFLNNEKFKEFRTAASNNDEKAKMILQALRQGSQEDVDRLVQDYYNIPGEEPIKAEPQVQPQEEGETAEPEVMDEATQITDVEPGSDTSVPEVEDLTELLDVETDGLFDENEIDGIDFSKFLGNKRRDGNRAKKNSEYFSAFNPQSRANYIEKKKNDYKAKFGDSLHDIDRQFKDYDMSIDAYATGVNDLLDDSVEMNVDTMNTAYNEIMDNNGIMHSFGRHWDQEDTNHIIEDLASMVQKYGKKNVLAALNVLKMDNSNFRDYRLGQINEEVERYNKSLDKILK